MKAYILTEEDFKRLCIVLDRNPEYGYDGGSSQPLSGVEATAFKAAHRFFNYQIRNWITDVKT
jgi:hypothetical protein